MTGGNRQKETPAEHHIPLEETARRLTNWVASKATKVLMPLHSEGRVRSTANVKTA